MPKYKSARILNFSFNHDSRKIKDEYFPFDTQHTLIHAENGIGKTLTCRLLSLPFTWGIRKNSNLYKLVGFDFDNIITDKNGPTYSCLELTLDGENDGYLLLVVGLEKSQEKNEVVKTVFATAYKDPKSELSIKSFPFYDNNGKLRRIKTIYDLLKNKSNVRIFGEYTNNNFNHHYSDFLAEFNISIDEKLLSLKAIGGEGGLTDIFKNEPTFEKMFSKHLLPLIVRRALVLQESEESAFKGFQDSIIENALDRKENKTKIDASKEYSLFVKDLETSKEIVHKIETAKNDKDMYSMQHIKAISIIREMLVSLCEEKERYEEEIKNCDKKIKQIKIDKVNYNLTKDEDAIDKLNADLQSLSSQKDNLQQIIELLHKKIAAYEGKLKLDEIEEIKGKINALNTLKKSLNDEQEIKHLNDLGNALFYLYSKELEEVENKILKIQTKSKENEQETISLQKSIDEIKITNARLETELKTIVKNIEEFKIYSEKLFVKYSQYSFPSFSQILMQTGIREFINEIKIKINDILKNVETAENNLKKLEEDNIIAKKQKEEYLNILSETQRCFEQKTDERKYIVEKLNDINSILVSCEFNKMSFEEIFDILSEIEDRVDKEQEKNFKLNNEIQKQKIFLNNIKNSKQDIDPALVSILEDNSIYYEYGSSILQAYAENKRKHVLESIPLLQYAIVVDNSGLHFLQTHRTTLLSRCCTPIFTRDIINQILSFSNTQTFDFLNTNVFASMPEQFYQDDFLRNTIKETEQDIVEKTCILKTNQEFVEQLNNIKFSIADLSKKYNKNTLSNLNKEIDDLQTKLNDLKQSVLNCTTKITSIEINIKSTNVSISQFKTELEKLTKLDEILYEYSKKFTNYQLKCSDRKTYEEQINKNNTCFDELRIKHNYCCETRVSIKEDEIRYCTHRAELQSKESLYKTYANNTKPTHLIDNFTISSLETEFNSYKQKADSTVQNIAIELQNAHNELDKKRKSYSEYMIISKKYGISDNDCRNAEKIDIVLENASLEKYSKEFNQISETCIRMETDIKNINIRKKENETLLLHLTDEPHNKLYTRYDFDNEEQKLVVSKGNLIEKKAHIESDIDVIKRRLKESQNSEKQVPIDFKFPHIITVHNFYEIIEIIEKNERVANKEYFYQCTNLNRWISDTESKYQNPTIKSMVLNIKKGTEDITIEKIELLITRCNNYIESVHKEIEFIEKNYDKILIDSKTFAYKLLQAFQKFDSVANSIKFSDGTKALEFKNLKNETRLCISPEDVENYIKITIEHCLTIDETEIKPYIEKNITEKTLLEHYIKLDSVKLMIAKKDKNNFYLTSYEEVIADKVSGAQKLLASFSLLLLICKYQSLEYHHTHTTSLIQDNPFGTSSTDHFVDAMFDLADACNVQLISLTALESEHIFEKHPVFLKYVLNKTKGGKEIVSVENTGGSVENVDEEISLFSSIYTIENV
jgi:hypothetical protein